MSDRRAQYSGPRVLPLAVAFLVLLAGVAALVVAQLRESSWRPAAEVTGVLATVPSGEPVALPAPLLAAGRGIRLAASGPGSVFVGVARESDARAYMRDHAVNVLRSSSGGVLQVGSEGTDRGPLDPQVADIWALASLGQGSAHAEWPQRSGQWAVIVQGASSVQVTWLRSTTVHGQPALVGLGLLLLVGGGTAVLVLLRSAGHRRRRALIGVDDNADDPDAGYLVVGPAIARSVLAGLLVISTLALVAGCSARADGSAVNAVPSRTGAEEPWPVVLPTQGQQICDQVDASVGEAARTTQAVLRAKGGAALGPRIVGPARAMLTAQIRVHAGLPKIPVAFGSFVRERLIVTQSTQWPRWIAEVGTDSTQATPVMRILVSPSAREPYALWGQVQLLPGSALPEVAPADRGSPTLSPDEAGLVTTPSSVVAGYADLLTTGRRATSAPWFGADAFRTQLAARLAADRVAFLGLGTVTAVHETLPQLGPVLSLRTADGGALVIGAIRQRYTVTLGKKGTQVALDPQAAALAGRPTFSVSGVRTALEVLAFTVPSGSGPPAGSVRLVAAGKMDVSVTGR